jgi:peptidoglycan/xylan/chitin deacetylase (PgdA/CDA1 family)
MNSKLTLIVCFTLIVAFSFTGCGVRRPDTEPVQSTQKPDITQPCGEAAPSELVTVPASAAVSVMPAFEAAAASAAVPPSPSTEASGTSFPPQAAERRAVPSRVPILYYHSISDKPVGIRELSVTVKNFDAQMRYLSENGYTPIMFDDLDDFTSFDKPVIITLDDGYADNYSNAYPILEKYGFRATIFVISGLIGAAGYLTREEMAEMTDTISFQGHTVRHENLTKLSPERLEEELTIPKETIGAITNAPVYVFAYPTGYYNDEVLKAVSKHYEYAVLINKGYYETGSDKLLIRRLYVHRDRTLAEFERALK